MHDGIRQIMLVPGMSGLLMLGACGGSSTVPATPLNLTGTWSGFYGPQGSGTALRLTWEAMHTGNVVSGVATLVKPAVGIQARGGLTGTLNGDRITLSYFVPSDSIPGFPRCAIGGLGNATVSNSRISGQLTTMVQSCEGTGLEPPATNELTLTK
jgi:hypothetical protein